MTDPSPAEKLQSAETPAADRASPEQLRTTESLGRAETTAGIGPPAVPGYEILEEMGRGGMGVVYKARQISLNRLVALKMIRDSALASPEQLNRFRTEAAAVARLDHPNIVQIHDLREHAGLPYFALEFVPGGTLAERLRQGRPSPRQAVLWVEPLARAVHYAHTQGIIHRDLKPGNILLTTDGMPKISDFGLAKRMDSESGLTPSTAVLGTPSYMAPEQASGRTKEIGPATDVYALGAILYECLTGKPPFEGETLLQTLDQVRFQEPVPPTQVDPAIPPDLEAVCLRCLQKEPARRYPSAADLADDLKRFLDGKPLVLPAEGPGDERFAVPGYEIWEEIARGGLWIVYKARDIRVKRLVAVKRARPGSPLTPSHLARLRTTVESAMGLKHANIVPILELSRPPGLHLVLEYVEGGTLARKLAGQPLPPSEAAQVIEVLALATHHAHQHGLIHCHLSLENVLIGLPGEKTPLTPLERDLGVLKLIGFEMAQKAGDLRAAEELATIRPTTAAMAPEQLFGKHGEVGPATDVYALGVMLYELLTGEPPYRAATTADLLLKVASELLQPPRRRNPDLPLALDRVCMKCLEKEPGERYTTAQALAEDLGRFLAGQKTLAQGKSWLARLADWFSGR